MLRRSVNVLALCLIIQCLGFGQTFRGGVAGTVEDQSGAAVAGAEVKLVSPNTGLTRTAATGNSGDFNFQDLPLGPYTLTVNSKGFQPQEIKGINVEAGRIFDLKATLSVASQATRVEVEASPVAVETSSTALTSVIPTKQILDIPLNGRDFTQLLKLNPGVTASGSVNGTRTNSINWQIDGADNNDQWHNSAAVNQGGVSGIAGTILPIDAIDEFSLQTNSNAEQGRNGGGVLNLVIKSGTNNFHGSLYYFNRNEFLAARNWYVSPTAPTQALRNNQEGGSLGGPIWKNHTFFFMTYEQQIYTGADTASGTVPSAAWVSAETTRITKLGFTVSPVALNLIANLWPSSITNLPGTKANFTSSANNTSNSYNGIIKLDHIFNEHNNIAFRYFGGTGQQEEAVGSAIPYYYQVAPSRMHNFSLVYNSVLNPKFVGQTVVGINYFKQQFNDANNGFNMPALGFNTGVTNPALFGSPAISISGFDGLGLTGRLGRIDTTGHLNQAYTLTEGNHTIRFGGEVRRARFDVYYERNSLGRFTFDGSVTGDGLGDFLAMQIAPSNATISVGNRQRNYYLNGLSFFGQDSWKVRHNLTLNYGVNWLYQGPISDPKNTISTFRSAYGGSGIEPVTALGSLWPRDLGDFAPRFGFVYQPGISNKLVVRGGYGIFYQVPNVNYFGDNRPPDNGATGILSNAFGNAPVYTITNSLPIQVVAGVPIFGNTQAPAGPFGAFSVSSHFKTGYSQNSNFNVQYQLNNNSVFELGYIGSLSRSLPVTLDINETPISAVPANSTSPAPKTSRPYYAQFPNLATINEVQSVGSGYYNGMAMSLRTSGFHGFTTKVNYTLGHARDDLSGTRGVTPQNSYCLRCDYGNADFDIRHSFNAFVNYVLPSPSRFKPVLGGWQLNTLISLNSGTPFTVASGSNTSGTSENNDRAQIVGNPFQNIPATVANTYVYIFNPAAFAAPAHGTYSNQARNSFYGPGSYQTDFSVFKSNRITERFTTQLRLEVFNLFNYRSLAGLDTGLRDGTSFGAVNQTSDNANGAPGIGQGAPRNVQLSLKLLF